MFQLKTSINQAKHILIKSFKQSYFNEKCQTNEINVTQSSNILYVKAYNLNQKCLFALLFCIKRSNSQKRPFASLLNIFKMQ